MFLHPDIFQRLPLPFPRSLPLKYPPASFQDKGNEFLIPEALLHDTPTCDSFLPLKARPPASWQRKWHSKFRSCFRLPENESHLTGRLLQQTFPHL